METGWPPPELLVTVSITSGMRLAAYSVDQGFERGDIHVALKRSGARGLAAFGGEQIDGFAPVNSTLARVVSKWVLLGMTVAFPAHHAKQNALGGAALVGGDHMLVAEDVLNRIAESGSKLRLPA